MNKPVWQSGFVQPRKQSEMPFGASNEAGLLVHKNSGFRTFRPVVDNETCINCCFCWIYCPEGCIDKSTGTIQIDYDYCKGCGVCAKECPKKCIEMTKEVQQDG